MNEEIWKPWPTNPKYQISSMGRVKGQNGRIMKAKSHIGYLWVNLVVVPKQPKTFSIHRLVAETFLPDFDASLTVDHINGIRYDNRVENLRMISRQENSQIKQIQYKEIYNLINQIIQLIGYEATKEKLDKIIEETS